MTTRAKMSCDVMLIFVSAPGLKIIIAASEFPFWHQRRSDRTLFSTSAAFCISSAAVASSSWEVGRCGNEHASAINLFAGSRRYEASMSISACPLPQERHECQDEFSFAITEIRNSAGKLVRKTILPNRIERVDIHMLCRGQAQPTALPALAGTDSS
jgi:hypothetical protein